MQHVHTTKSGASDFWARSISAAVMIVIASLAVWAGGIFFDLFAAVIGTIIIAEWIALTNRFTTKLSAKVWWAIGGVAYVSAGIATLAYLNAGPNRLAELLTPICLVVATDVGAYIVGRSFGGPKIAPSISPSKTWSGLAGGMAAAAATAILIITTMIEKTDPLQIAVAAGLGSIAAVVAQAGDFFESCMKRRAGVKDSGNWIPGHGGAFDRADGLLTVLLAMGFIQALQGLRQP